MRVGKSAASKRVIGPTPERPAMSAVQFFSTPVPSGVTRPDTRHDDPSRAVLCAVFHEPRHARKGGIGSQVAWAARCWSRCPRRSRPECAPSTARTHMATARAAPRPALSGSSRASAARTRSLTATLATTVPLRASAADRPRRRTCARCRRRCGRRRAACDPRSTSPGSGVRRCRPTPDRLRRSAPSLGRSGRVAVGFELDADRRPPSARGSAHRPAAHPTAPPARRSRNGARRSARSRDRGDRPARSRATRRRRRDAR